MENFYNQIPVWANVPARGTMAISQVNTPARGPMEISQVNIPVDRGPVPFVVDIEDVTEDNTNFRTTLWTGNHMQLTVMSINVGDDIGLEQHTGVDQFFRIEEGEGLVMMGNSESNLTLRQRVSDDDAVIVPSGVWHNIINTGRKPLKLYSIYAPPEHPRGTIHVTKADE